jgi:hypothetical protein
MQTLYRLTNTPMWLPNYPSKRLCPRLQDPDLRHELLGNGARPDAVLLVYPSVASPDRLTRELIDAFCNLSDRYHLLTFVDDDQYGLACREQVRASGIETRVNLMSPVPFEQLDSILACADVGAIFHNAGASSGYFMANADRLSGYLTHAVPYVASDVPNMEAVTYRHRLGVCCDAEDSMAIAHSITRLVEDSPGLQIRRRWVEEARDTRLHFEEYAVHLSQEIKRMCALDVE